MSKHGIMALGVLSFEIKEALGTHALSHRTACGENSIPNIIYDLIYAIHNEWLLLYAYRHPISTMKQGQ